MGMPYKVTLGGALKHEEQEALQTLVHATFDEVHTIYNNWNPQSEISLLNRSEQFELSFKLEKLFVITEQLVTLTAGLFDPTIEPLRALWKSHLEAGSIPNEKEVANAREKIGWKKIVKQEHLLSKERDLCIDFCGVSKGYAVDLITERLLEAGMRNIYVEWGGEIRTAGSHPSGRPWRIYIAGFEDANPSAALAFVTLNNQAIATSGDYIHYWTVDGIRYSHLINPKSGQPTILSQDSVASASVIAPTCAIADGLATAALLFNSFEEARLWADKIEEQNPEITFYLAARGAP